MPGVTLSYDIENRVSQISGSFGTEYYGCGLAGRRIYVKYPDGTAKVFFYGAGGELMATYDWSGYLSNPKRVMYFAGKMIQWQGAPVALDRLDSVRVKNNSSSEVSSYYPFGEERTATSQNRPKFATYFRDGTAGLDYAQQRYYSSTLGRFLTPDPYGGSAKPESSQSWNRYAYVNNDPINNIDPSGLGKCPPNDPNCIDVYGDAPGGLDPNSERVYAQLTRDGGRSTRPTVTIQDVYDVHPRKPSKLCDNKEAVAFVKDNLEDAKKLADKLQVPVQFVLAVSANESTYGQYPTAIAANNIFGIHSGSIPEANGSTGPYSGNPIFAAWKPGTNGFLGSGNAFGSIAMSDNAKGMKNPRDFFTAIHKQFGVGTPSYVSDMLKVLNAVTVRLTCPN
jgi:RHS repeat-associated protein